MNEIQRLGTREASNEETASIVSKFPHVGLLMRNGRLLPYYIERWGDPTKNKLITCPLFNGSLTTVMVLTFCQYAPKYN